MFPRTRFLALPNLCAVLLFWLSPVLVAAQVMTVQHEVHRDVSPALRDLADAAPGVTASAPVIAPAHSAPLPRGNGSTSASDPALQAPDSAGPDAPTAGLNFEGLGDASLGFTVQNVVPDTNGAVGLTQYVQWVNASFAVFNKTDGLLIAGPTTGSALWTGFGGACETNNDGSPIVTYDRISDRWVFTQFAVHGRNGTTLPFLQCVAVSTSADATGSYYRYAFTYSSQNDSPKMGVWPDAYYVTFNVFDSSGTTFLGADACAYDRNAMIGGLTATQICFQSSNQVAGLLPADFDGTNLPPLGSPSYMMFFDANSLRLFKFHADFAAPANSTFTGPTVIVVSPFTPLCCVTQPTQPGAPDQLLDSLGNRLMSRLAYRNFGDHEALVMNHSVAVNNGGGIRWYELRDPNGTPTLFQQSTYAPTADFRWMGSMAMDDAGNIAIGYNLASATIFPSLAVTGRLASDPVNTMEAESTIIAGGGSQASNSQSVSSWGAYSAMQIDPSDDCTFWFTGEYMKTTGILNWHTRIANFKFPGCHLPPVLTVRKPGTGQGTVTSNDSFINCGSTCSHVYSLGDSVTLTATAASGSTFTGWSGACSGTSTCVLTMNTPLTAVATFTSNNAPNALRFIPANPCRIADTRLANGPFGGPFLSAQAVRGFTIPNSACNIPNTAQAYSLNVTVVPHSPLGFLTTFPCGQPQPLVSTLNSSDGRVKAVAAIVPSRTNGAVCFFVTNDTDLVLDINGYFVPDSTPSSLSFYPVTPCRLVDTRNAAGPLGGPSLVGNATRTFPLLSSPCNVPAAQAYSLNFTSVPKGPLGFLTTWPAGQSLPLVSTLNAPTGAVTANAAIVPSGSNGDINVFVTQNSDLVIDINGYFAAPGTGGLSLYGITPCRVIDTRNPAGSPPISGTNSYDVVGSGCGAPSTAQAFVLNATVVPPSGLGFLTLWSKGGSQPLVSTLNASDGFVTSNLAIVPTTNSSVSAFPSNPTHLILDMSGYFAP